MDLKVQNKALLLKYVHKFIHKADVPWVMIIWHAYYDETPPHARPSCGSFWWRDVFSLMSIYRGITTCIPAAGDTILLWKDLWNGDDLLMNSHQHLFSFAHNEDISLSQFCADPNPASHFFLPMSIEAREELDSLNQLVSVLHLEPMAIDSWILSWGDIQFKPRKFYRFVFRNINAPTYITAIWKSKCMLRHKVFAWLMLMDKINTRDMLIRRQFQIGDDHSCLLCTVQPLESNTHLFFGCAFSTTCWNTLGIQWDTNLGLQDMIDRANASWHKPLFQECIFLSSWNIWKLRNRVYFDGIAASHGEWLRMLKSDLEILRFRVSPELSSFLEGFIPTLVI